MTRPACLAPGTVDREGGDCARPDCQAHEVNEDGPAVVKPWCGYVGGRHLSGCSDTYCELGGKRTSLRNPDHDTACRCNGCLADPYVDPA